MPPPPRGALPLVRAASNWAKNVLYVDRGVIVLNKPPGLICQRDQSTVDAKGAKNDFNELLSDLKEQLNLSCIPFPVHRLDKCTTGSLVLARSAALARELSQQFQSRTVEKTYLALVHRGGESFQRKSGEIRAALKFIDGRASLGSLEDGKYAATDWELIASSSVAPISLVRLKLYTGLKHQLRVHMAHCLQTPILGDNLHSPKRLSEAVRSLIRVPDNRVFLHSSQLSFFRYRKSGANKRFRLSLCSPLPCDFLEICSEAGIQVDRNEAEGGMFVDGVHAQRCELPDVDGHWLN